jgi:anti-anti-sigma factor
MLRIERTPDGEGRVFRLVGELDSGTRRQFERVAVGPAGDGGGLTLDLGDLIACDPSGVESLVSLTRRAQLAGGRLALCSPREQVQQVLHEANLQISTSLPDGHAQQVSS